MKRTMSYSFAGAFAFLAMLSTAAPSFGQQTPDTLSMEQVMVKLSEAEKFRSEYNFPAAVDVCTEIEDAVIPEEAEHLFSESMLLSSNGENMMDFCSTPKVVAKQRFHLKDFFLHYPLKDRSWRNTPNVLDTLGGDFAHVIYFPEGIREAIYSAYDGQARNLYRTTWQDSVWTAPELLSEGVTSSEDEIYPILSPDGRRLYFASKGLFGMGGFDLYVSVKDTRTGEWGVPENMGFPYSSPYNDYLYCVSDDMRYAYFASDRECPGSDSVYVYVVEYDTSPIRKHISSAKDLAKLSRLDLPEVNTSSGSDKRVDTYLSYYSNIADLKEKIRVSSESMDRMRTSLSGASASQKNTLLADIQKMEQDIPVLQDSLNKETRRLQDYEMDLLSEGIVIDPIKELKKKSASEGNGFSFPNLRIGQNLAIKVLEPEPVFDYSFQVLPEGRFALDNTLPSGLVYQIQLFSQQTKAEPAKLGGLSPVFTREDQPGKVVHTAGLFRTYKDVLANLPKARQSFKSAFIVAFLDGKPVTVAKAREVEKTIQETYLIRIYPNDGANLSAAARAAVSVVCDKELVRESVAGKVSFTLSGFGSKEEADATARLLKSSGLSNVSVESAGLSMP